MGAASDVLPNLKVAMPIVDKQSRSMGVQLNYDAGKSQALVCFKGAGSVQVKQDVPGAENPCIPGQGGVHLKSLGCRQIYRYTSRECAVPHHLISR